MIIITIHRYHITFAVSVILQWSYNASLCFCFKGTVTDKISEQNLFQDDDRSAVRSKMQTYH